MGRLPSEVERGSEMAVRYSMTDAFKVLVENKDAEAMDDIFRRYGGVARKMLRVICGANDIDSLVELMELVPEYVSMQKVNKINRELAEDVADEDEEPEEEPKQKKAPAKKAAPKAKAKPVPEPEDEDEDDEDEDEETGPYDGKNARELFELCKERGIKTQPRKRATTYKKLLEEWDIAHANEPDDVEEEDDDDDEDWDI